MCVVKFKRNSNVNKITFKREISVGYPLTVIGGIFGKNWAGSFDAPCRTKNIAREIPAIPWYRSAWAHCVVGGFLPFRYELAICTSENYSGLEIPLHSSIKNFSVGFKWVDIAKFRMMIYFDFYCSAISVELYYIFATLWGREQYTLYGILFIVYGILLSVTACIAVALTYFQLSSEDYRWWWRSIFSAGYVSFFNVELMRTRKTKRCCLSHAMTMSTD